ncbi:hypothetical protein DFH07DRAFT_235999 [Mycena maculata]|uniref:Uncharacterized protein n=1 Tax=Mycena maculata TaxID=230809 RepID=A0AAD7MPB6_9AGAR|nr:hypothetical protein DFH07DRAFT_235999 [Mycena maculata]
MTVVQPSSNEICTGLKTWKNQSTDYKVGPRGLAIGCGMFVLVGFTRSKEGLNFGLEDPRSIEGNWGWANSQKLSRPFPSGPWNPSGVADFTTGTLALSRVCFTEIEAKTPVQYQYLHVGQSVDSKVVRVPRDALNVNISSYIIRVEWMRILWAKSWIASCPSLIRNSPPSSQAITMTSKRCQMDASSAAMLYLSSLTLRFRSAGTCAGPIRRGDGVRHFQFARRQSGSSWCAPAKTYTSTSFISLRQSAYASLRSKGDRRTRFYLAPCTPRFSERLDRLR